MGKTIPFSVVQFAIPALIFFAAVASSVPYSHTIQAHYEAQARVWIQAQLPGGGVTGDSQGSPYMPFMTFFNSPIQTSSELIRSGEVVRQASVLLKERYPNEHMPEEGEIAGGLTCVPIKETDILLVKYSGSNPKQAAAVLQAVLDGFVEVSSNQSTASATKARQTIELQLTQAQKKFSEVAAKLESFQNRHNVARMDAGIEALESKVSETEDNVHEDEIELAKQQRHVAELEREIAGQQQSNSDADKAVVKAMEDKLAQQQIRYMEASQSLTANHPYIKRLRSSIEKTKQAISEAQSRIPPETSNSSDLKNELHMAKEAIPQLQAQLSGHNSYLLALERKRAELPAQSIEFSELTREKQLITNTISELERKLQTATVVESVSHEATNIKIIDKPLVPSLPLGPSKNVIMSVAAVVGLVLGVIAYIVIRQFNPFVTDVGQIQSMLGLTIAGFLGAVREIDARHLDYVRRSVKKSMNDAKRVVIASADEGDGKTSVAVALATSLAANGTRVVLVETDSNSSALCASMLKVAPGPGLREYIESHGTINPVKTVSENLMLVTAGEAQSAGSFAEHPDVINLFVELEHAADLIIFDTAAATISGQYSSLFESPALLLVIVRMRKTRKGSLAMLASQVSQLKHHGAMVVLTDAKSTDLMVAATPTPVAPGKVTEKQEEEEQSIW